MTDATVRHDHLNDHLSASEFTLAAYNAHWGVARRGVRSGARFDVAEIVRGFDADVVVVPEAWRDLSGRGFLDELVDDGYRIEVLPFVTYRHGVREPSRGHPGEGVWELALCSRLPILARWTIPIGSIRHDPASPRFALACTIDVNGSEVDIVGVHVSSRLWTFAPLRHLNALRPQLPPPDRLAVLAGDCNFWGPGVVSVLPGWRRAFRGRTFPAVHPHSHIDHVLVRDNVSVVWGEVLGETPSDHRPVRARLRVAPLSLPGNIEPVG
ncbi:MAG TPA: endonuclease/exonuclease/phosphatase family protein [Acidimicrobiia bacterium]|nr:endonuclease/exonuclease/phosphatase family protein [Acidimicrobiia bacterium]